MIKTRRNFFKQAVKNPTTVGAIAPFSQTTIRKMLEKIDFSQTLHIVEFGAGQGNVTKQILADMHPGAKLLACEINDAFIKDLQVLASKDAKLQVIHDGAQYIEKYCAAGSVDVIVSTVPFSILGEELRNSILQAAHRILKPGWIFLTPQYSTYNKKEFSDFIGDVEVTFCAMNVPPAFIFRAVKEHTRGVS